MEIRSVYISCAHKIIQLYTMRHQYNNESSARTAAMVVKTCGKYARCLGAAGGCCCCCISAAVAEDKIRSKDTPPPVGISRVINTLSANFVAQDEASGRSFVHQQLCDPLARSSSKIDHYIVVKKKIDEKKRVATSVAADAARRRRK